MTSLPWLLAAVPALLATAFFLLLPACALLLACVAVLRARLRTEGVSGGGRPSSPPGPWGRAATSFFRGTVFHVRRQPTLHSFRYPLYFAVVDLDEAPGLFGRENVRPGPGPARSPPEDPRGSLWPLSSLMLLREEDHLKNGEGLPGDAGAADARGQTSMRERVERLVRERTGGALDLRGEGRRILLVTHLMYFGYCFNPVSFYFILKHNENESEDESGGSDREEEIEAVVLEISNTPWNEMSVKVLHPASADTVRFSLDPPGDSSGFMAKTYRYRMLKKFHVSPFMTMDYAYDWKFQMSRDRIRAESRSVKRMTETVRGDKDGAPPDGGAGNRGDGPLHFVAGFDVRRSVLPTSTYPLQLARVISRFPIYCFVIQIWIHYEALRLLMKGVEFIPHPEGSETGASRAIAAVMWPVFAAMDVADAWWSGGDGGKRKDA